LVNDPLLVMAPVEALGEPVVALAERVLPDTVLERDWLDMTELWVELSVLCELLVLFELLVELLELVVVSTERLELSVVVTA
jgi:hypothetical protein